MKLALSNAAAATSGNYERFYTIKGRRFSHIFNPRTETSAQEVSSVTIISTNGSESDALATALNVMGVKKGLELVEKMGTSQAIFVPAENNDTLIKSSGAEKYIF
ncbi:MAG: Thiamine biosynthesis lipoprotein ApbE precursor [Elusimicrobia bacterium ADurb.Bin231]|nr:MAG: Thiamine biosynthesis lipoprotein ApbE precursor [Elusimicrobia bacterium ADurb.Bin231]